MMIRSWRAFITLNLIFAFLSLNVIAFVLSKGRVVIAATPGSVLKMTAESDKKPSQFKVQTWNPFRLAVLRLGLTEPAWTSPLNYGKKDGIYNCAYCGKELFDSAMKYNSGSGWPSFWRTASEGSVKYRQELDGRVECLCGRCNSHLGHVFLDGPRKGEVSQDLVATIPLSDPSSNRDPRQLPRFCMNGAALQLTTEKDSPKEGK